MSASNAIEHATHATLAKCLEMDSPLPEHMVVAVEYAQEKKGRRYAVIRGDDDGSAYDAVLEYLASHSDASSRSNGAEYALHEVVRAGLPRRVMFDIDYNSPVSLEQLKSDARLLQEAYARAFESYDNPWEIDLSVKSFALTVSDSAAPFKGFHLLHTRVVMPAASVARIYALIKEILEETPAGRALAAVLDPKPATDTFNMRLYGSPKFVRQPRKKAVLVRQKRLLDEEDSVYFEPNESMRDYVIQPAPGLSSDPSDYCIYEVALHADDEQTTIRKGDALDLSDAALARLSSCELLNGWEPRGEVKSGEIVKGDRKTTWWRLDLTLTSGQRHECSVCKRVHEHRTDYLWLTGEGLVDASKPIYIRCRARVQTAEEKAVKNHRYNVVQELPGTQALGQQTKPSLVAPVLTYAFSFEGYTGKALKTPLTAFLAPQRLAHVAAIDALDRSAETKRNAKAQLNSDLATAVAHQITVMERAQEAQTEETNPLLDALAELKKKGADYSIYGQRDFDDLDTRVYQSEYEMLCAIHCNAWTHDREGAAFWDEGRWEPKTWDEQRIKDKREQMRFRIASGAHYSGKAFWRMITRAYARNSPTSFTPHPLGRSAVGLPSPSIWRMGRGINNYEGLRAVNEIVSAHGSPRQVLAQAEHLATFEHFLRTQIAGEGDEYYRYLMGWLASAMQRPHEKIGVALLIRGPMGCGKSLLVNLLKRIVPHASVVTNKGLATLTDKFNTDLDNRTLYMFGEVPEARRVTHEQVAALKTIITDDTLHIEYKNQTIVQKKQYLNLIVCSNMLNCISTSEGDRRWCVLNTPFPVHDKDDFEYWERVWPLFTSDTAFAASIQQMLLNYDLGVPGSFSAWNAKEYPKSEALQVTRNELPIVNYALKYPNLRQRVTSYLENCGGYEADRPATLRDIVVCHRMDEGDSARGDSAEQQEKDLYYAMCNVPQIAQRFAFHPDNNGGRLARMDATGREEVLKHAIVWGVEDGSRTDEEGATGTLGGHIASAAVRERDAAMVEMVKMMKAAGMDVSKFVTQFPALGEGPERYDSMGRAALRALLKERGVAYSGSDSVAALRARARSSSE
jgi:Family of unknown function (DUF5906)